MWDGGNVWDYSNHNLEGTEKKKANAIVSDRKQQ